MAVLIMQRVKLIVLKTFPFSEADLILTGIDSFGRRMRFIAKGALKSRRSFAGGVLEPCSFIRAEYRPSKKSLHKMFQAWFLRDFRGLREDYSRLTLALRFAGLIESFSTEEEESGAGGYSKELFHLLGNGLSEAETSPCLESLKLFFYTKLLFLQGALPNPERHRQILSRSLREHRDFTPDPKDLLRSEEALNEYINSP